MNISLVKDAVTSRFARQILSTQKVSPVILFSVGVVGIVGTVVLASRATLRLDEVLEETNEKLDQIKTVVASEDLLKTGIYTDSDRKRDMALTYTNAVVRVAKLYGPSILLGTVSIAALTGSQVILTKRNIALTAAYAGLEKGFSEYRKRVVDEYGEEKDQHFRFGTIKQETVETDEKGKTTTKVTEVVDPTGFSVYARFFDEASPQWSKTPEYNRLFLQNIQNWANDKLRAQGHLFLNEVHDMLQIDRTKAGSVVGWILNGEGDNFVDFGIFNGKYERAIAFVNGYERSIRLDFNVNGVIYDKI